MFAPPLSMNIRHGLPVPARSHFPFDVMMLQFRICTVPTVLIALLLFATAAHSQVRGGYETFTNEDNALSWGLYDFSDGQFYTPGWDLSQTGNPEIYGFVTPNSSISLFADVLSSDASFVGDFSAENISGLSCDAYVDDAISLLGADFYVVSGGTFYYSVVFAYPDHFAEDGWDYMETSFENDPWFIYENGGFVEVEITDSILSNVSEVGIDFFTTSDAPADVIVAIDNFSLIPEVIVPTMSISQNGGNIELGFQRETGQIYDILQSPDLSGWAELTGYSGITGSGPFIASDPIAERKFFKLGTEAYFTPIPDIGPSTP